MDNLKALSAHRSSHTDRYFVTRACTGFVALMWLASCQNGSAQPVSSSFYARSQGPSVADDLQPRPPAPVGGVLNPWAGRSGQAEALADIAHGRPIKFYTHVLGGERAQFRTPGLLNCDPERSARDAEWLFAPLSDANMSEGIIYTPAQRLRQRAASAFAKAYNLTIFEQKRDQVLKICPATTLEKITVKPSAAAENQPYRWLTTAELEALLRGSRIVEDDNRPSLMLTPEEFHENGHYVLHGDNYEAHGKYSFRDDVVCARAERDPEVCRKVLIDRNGRYWIVARTNHRILVKISVESLR